MIDETMKKIEQELTALKMETKLPVNFIVAVMLNGKCHGTRVRLDTANDHHFLDLLRDIIAGWDDCNHCDKRQ